MVQTTLLLRIIALQHEALYGTSQPADHPVLLFILTVMRIEIGAEGVATRAFLQVEHPVRRLVGESRVISGFSRPFVHIAPIRAVGEENAGNHQTQQNDLEEGHRSLLFPALDAPNRARVKDRNGPKGCGSAASR